MQGKVTSPPMMTLKIPDKLTKVDNNAQCREGYLYFSHNP
jgi:hypothetical protein